PREEHRQQLIAQRAIVELVALRAAPVDEELHEPRACEVVAPLGFEVLVHTNVDRAHGRREPVGPTVAAPPQELHDAARRARPAVFDRDGGLAESLRDALETGAHEVIARQQLRQAQELRVYVADAPLRGVALPAVEKLARELRHPWH